MPLVQGKTKESMGKNIATEINSGKPKSQAVAIAYSVMRKNRAKKMAKGGEIEADIDGNLMPENIDGCNEHMFSGGDIARRIHMKRMARGGAVDEYPEVTEGGDVGDPMYDEAHEVEDYGHTADDLASDDADNAEAIPIKDARRGMLHGIMRSLHKRHSLR